jgi:hypothetical protein
MQLRLILYLMKHSYEGFSHLFQAFYVIYVVIKCALSQIVRVLFVSSFDFFYLVQSSWNCITSHYTGCVCGCGHREEFYLFISQFSWPKKLNILLWICVSLYNAFGKFLLIFIHIITVWCIVCEGDEFKEIDYMGRSCSTCENQKCIQIFGQRTWKKETSW